MKPTRGSLISSSYNDGSGTAVASLGFADTVLDGTWRQYSLTFTNQSAVAMEGHFDRFLAGIGDDATGIMLWGPKIIEQPAAVASGTNIAAAPWQVSGATASASSVAAPSATVPARKLAETASSGTHRLSQAVSLNGQRQTYRVDLKAGERSKAMVSLFDGQVEHGVYVDLAAGKITGTIGTLAASSAISRGNGWYTVTLIADAAPGAGNCSVTVLDAAGNSSYAGTAGSGLYVSNVSLSGTAVNDPLFLAGTDGKQGKAVQPNAMGMVIRYGPPGSAKTGAYTYTATLTRTAATADFVLDASSIIPPKTPGSFDYTYELYADAACTVPFNDVLGQPIKVTGTVNVGSSAAASQVQWTLSGLGAEDRVIKRSQAYNAFGEVISETDGRGNVTDLKYSTMGLLIEKSAPAVDYLKADGTGALLRQTGVTKTLYRYDLLGRLVGTVDANGVLNTQQWVAGDKEHLTREFHADGGVRKNEYDSFGDLRTATDELSRVTKYGYDRMGRLTKLERPIRRANDASKGNAGSADIQAIEYYGYDEAGNRVSHSSSFMTSTYGSAAVERTVFDAMGRVRSFTSFGNTTTSYQYVYDAAIKGAGDRAVGGYRLTTTLADGHASVDETSVFGALARHVDYGGHTFVYSHDSAGRLTSQTSAETGQNISYTYYSNGYIKSITDNALGTVTGYEYDKAGNRVREYYQKGTGTSAQVLQNAVISYDAMNRVQSIRDGGADIGYEYDANGNRIHVKSYYHDGVDGHASTQEYWYAYDQMNRFVVTKGDYDASSRCVVAGAGGTLVGYDQAGQRRLATTGNTTELYSYSDDGYLIDTTINGALYARRIVDLAGRSAGYQQNDASGVLTRSTAYDADHRVLSQNDTTVKDGKVTRSASTSYAYYNSSAENQTDISATGKGQLARTVAEITDTDYSKSPAATTRTTATNFRTYQWWDEAKVILETAHNVNVQVKAEKGSKGFSYIVGNAVAGGGKVTYANGFAVRTYDVNGHLMRVDDPANQTPGVTDKGRSISYVTNAQGLILSRTEVANGNANETTGLVTGGTALKFRRFYYLDGHAVGDVSNDGIDQSQTSYAEQMAAIEKQDREKGKQDRYAKWEPVSSADFDQSYQPINSGYPAGAPYSYTVRSGSETLQSIALSVWGDSSMWYLIADANGLNGNTPLVAGQSLTIPNKVTNIHNNSGTYRVYDPGVAIGDVSPTAPYPPPPPPPKKGSGGFLQVIVAAVAIVVTAIVAPQLITFLAEALGPVLGAAAPAVAEIGGYAIASAAGSIASQTVAIATGLQEDFSWSAVGQAALSAAVTAGLGRVGLGNFDLGTGSKLVAHGVRAAAGSVITQGLQGKFDWRNVAAAGLGGAAGYGVGELLGPTLSDVLGAEAGKAATARLSQVTTSAVRSGVSDQKTNWVSIAADTFGSMLGDAVVERITRKDATEQPQIQARAAGPRGAETLAGLASAWLGTAGDIAARLVFDASQTAFAQSGAQDGSAAADAEAPITEVPPQPGMILTDQGWIFPNGIKGQAGEQFAALDGDLSRSLRGQVIVFSGGRRVVLTANGPVLVNSDGSLNQLEDRTPRNDSAFRRVLEGAPETASDEPGQAYGEEREDYERNMRNPLRRAHSGGVMFSKGGEIALELLAPDEYSLLGGAAGKLAGKAAIKLAMLPGILLKAGKGSAAEMRFLKKAAAEGFETSESVVVGSGGRVIDIAQEYEKGVARQYGAVTFKERRYEAFVDGKLVSGVADNVATIAGKLTAVEAKFVGDWGRSLRNPGSAIGSKSFAIAEQEKVIDQARRYSETFDGGVVYHTNSLEFAKHYAAAFIDAGIKNFKFIVTPAVTR